MRWEILIIPLIALGVWIFGTLFRSENDKTKKGAGRRGNASGRAPGRRVVTDLDRFLEEARRRREPEEPRKVQPPPSRTPAARPPQRQPSPRSQELPRTVKPVIVQEEPLVAQPVPQPQASPPIAKPVPSPLQVLEPPPRPAPAARLSPIMQQARSLLSKPQTAATAFVLREIFDRPLCKRRR